MDPKLLSAFADIAWPLLFIGVLLYLRKDLKRLLASGSEFAFEFMGSKLTVKPTEGIATRSEPGETGTSQPELDPPSGEPPFPQTTCTLITHRFFDPICRRNFGQKLKFPTPIMIYVLWSIPIIEVH